MMSSKINYEVIHEVIHGLAWNSSSNELKIIRLIDLKSLESIERSFRVIKQIMRNIRESLRIIRKDRIRWH